jgi:hypothetical protein
MAFSKKHKPTHPLGWQSVLQGTKHLQRSTSCQSQEALEMVFNRRWQEIAASQLRM